MLRLLKNLDQFSSVFVFTHREEGVGGAFSVGTTGTTYSVDVVLDLHWEIVVNYKFNVFDIYRKGYIGRWVVIPIPLEATSVAIRI